MSNILFYIGTVSILVAFCCAVASNFITSDKTKNILVWITACTSLLSMILFIILMFI